ncbi:putative F-box domain-containing protein [Helianthus debilis subsp. tardiflorus]
MGADSNLHRQRTWTDLPMEILSFIAIRLRLLELLSFRGTCKDFRSASTTATAKIESLKKPWLLFHKPGDSKCVIYNEDGSKTYNRHIPDLNDAICLASYQGWLLLYKHESIFFFSPFSLSKIPLPDFPRKQTTDGLVGHVASFSEPPTSPNCIVSIINPIENSHFEINMISKGQDKWTQHKITPYSIGTVSGAIFDHESKMFYYMYGENKVLTFSVMDKKWKPYKIVSDRKGDSEDLPYIYFENMFDKFMKTHGGLLNLEEDEYVDVCGLTFEPENSSYPRMYLNEAVDVSPTKTRMSKAVWIQPRFYEAHKDLHW